MNNIYDTICCMKRVRKFSYAVAGSVLLLAVLSHSGCNSSCTYVVTDGTGTFSLPYCNSPRAVFRAVCEGGMPQTTLPDSEELILYTTPGVTACFSCDDGNSPESDGSCNRPVAGGGGGVTDVSALVPRGGVTISMALPHFIKSVSALIGDNYYTYTHSISDVRTSVGVTGNNPRIDVRQFDPSTAGWTSSTGNTSLTHRANDNTDTGDILVTPILGSPALIVGQGGQVDIIPIGADGMLDTSRRLLIVASTSTVGGNAGNDNYLYFIDKMGASSNAPDYLFVSGFDENKLQRAITVYQLATGSTSYEARLILDRAILMGNDTYHGIHGFAVTNVNNVLRLHIAVSTANAASTAYSYGIITATFTPDTTALQSGSLTSPQYNRISSPAIMTPPDPNESGIISRTIVNGGSTRHFLFFTAAELNGIYAFEDTGTDLSMASANTFSAPWASDSSARSIGGASSPDYVTFKGSDYLFAAGPGELNDDHGFSVFQIMPPLADTLPRVNHVFSSSVAHPTNPVPELANIASLGADVFVDAADSANNRLFVFTSGSPSANDDVDIRAYEITVP